MKQVELGDLYMALVAIDAGHGGSNPGAVYNGRQEKDDVLNLALAVGPILEANGVDVYYTRTTDVYESPYQKAREANNAGADYFVSIHRNSSPYPNQYSGVETLVYRANSTAATMAENIDAELSQVGFTDLGINERPNLVVLNSTQMPAVLIEAGFINNDTDNQIFDARFDEIAQAIADGVLRTIWNS
jgi:N-acetylmuramoyl-L-alanine amidase